MTEVQTVMRRAGLGFLAVLLWSAGPSQAGTLEIQFDLSPTTYAINIGPLPTPPSGQSFTLQMTPQPSVGSLLLRIDGVDGSGALLGAAANVSLMGLSLTAGAIASVAEIPIDTLARLDQDVLTQAGVARGVFDGARIVFAAGQIAGQHAASSQCQGTFCAVIAGFSVLGRAPGPFSNSSDFALALTLLGQPGGAMLRAEAAFPFGASGPFASPFIRINGREVSRAFAPEPSEAGLMATLVLALAAAARRRSRRGLEPGAQHA
jgi:hypothetical protein